MSKEQNDINYYVLCNTLKNGNYNKLGMGFDMEKTKKEQLMAFAEEIFLNRKDDGNKDIEEQIRRGLDDAKQGRTETADNVFKAFPHIVQGLQYYRSKEFDKAAEEYNEVVNIYENPYFIGNAYFDLGLIYYRFQKPDILYSKAYFDLSLDHGYKDSSFFLASIYEQEPTAGINIEKEDIKRLYEEAASDSRDERIKKLAQEALEEYQDIKPKQIIKNPNKK